MRRLLCMVLTGAVMIGCLCTGTGAVDESNVVSYSFETTGTAITRCPVSIIKNTPFKKVLKRAFTYIGTEKSKTTHLKLNKFLFHFRTIRQW